MSHTETFNMLNTVTGKVFPNRETKCLSAFYVNSSMRFIPQINFGDFSLSFSKDIHPMNEYLKYYRESCCNKD